MPDNLPLLNALPLVGDQLGLLLLVGLHQVGDGLVFKALVGGFFGELPRLIRSALSPIIRWPARWLAIFIDWIARGPETSSANINFDD